MQCSAANSSHQAVHWLPESHSAYNWKFGPFNRHLPSSLTHQPLGTTNLLSVSVSLALMDSP